MTNEDEARAAALKAYPHRNPYLEGGAYMGEERSRVPLRDAFVEGAMWAASRVSTPPTITDDVRRAATPTAALHPGGETNGN